MSHFDRPQTDILFDKFTSVLFYLVLALTFLVGGFLQFFLGVPNTVYTILITGFIYGIIVLNVLKTRKIIFNLIVFTCHAYILVILISGIVNKSDIKAIVLYTIFPLIPLGVYVLIHILKRRKIFVRSFIRKFFTIVVLLQLPVVLIQKMGYDFFINFNNSSQRINEYDCMFGTFFLKADHSLGFFLLIYLLSLIAKAKENKHTFSTYFLIVYTVVTILIIESNLTKALLFVVFLYHIFIWLYKRLKFESIILFALLAYIIASIALTVPAISGEYFYLKNKYNVEESTIAFEKGYAKRPQVVIAMLQGQPLKWIGEGPYDYYDIFDRKFKNTKHFSQLIWSYNDLGIIGLLVVAFLSIKLISSLHLDRKSRILVFIILFSYLFMTNAFSDLAIMITLLILKR